MDTAEAARARDAVGEAIKFYMGLRKEKPKPEPTKEAVIQNTPVPMDDEEELLDDTEVKAIKATVAKAGGTEHEQFKRLATQLREACSAKRRKQGG